MALILLIGLSAGCDSAVPSPYIVHPTNPRVTPVPSDVADLRVEMVRAVGSERDGDLWFGRLFDGALHPDGERFVVVDPLRCRVVKLRWGREEHVSFGDCGDGPGEFRRPMRVAFKSDTVVVVDQLTQQRVYLSPDGRFLRRERAHEAIALGTVTRPFAFATETIMVEAPGRNTPEPTYEGDNFFLSLRYAGTGDRLGFELPRSEMAQSPAVGGGANLCAAPLGSPHEGLVAVTHPWAPELVIFDVRERDVAAAAHPPVDWGSPRPGEQEGTWYPGAHPPPDVVCGSEHILLARVELKYPEPGPGIDRADVDPRSVVPITVGARWDLFRYDGTLIATAEEVGEVGDPLRPRPIGLAGNRVIAIANNLMGHPAVIELRLEWD